MIAFGPVPSRRLGRSLGINHIPPKVCTYSCVYCQVGRTTRLTCRRSAFRIPEEVAEAVAEKLGAARAAATSVDYLTFVPDGEPTLDRNLGATIEALRPLGLPIAVVSNGSLLDREDVREDLGRADLVSLKIDSVDGATWHRVNRPHRRLRLPAILEGMLEFASTYSGRLVTETMMLSGVDEGEARVRDTASFVGRLRPWTAYVAVPTRPPAEPWVRPATPPHVARAYEVFRALAGPTELLVDYEGDGFAPTGDARRDLLGIMSVHPMREQAVLRFLARAGAPAGLVGDMIRRGEVVQTSYGGHRYLLRATTSPRMSTRGDPS